MVGGVQDFSIQFYLSMTLERFAHVQIMKSDNKNQKISII